MKNKQTKQKVLIIDQRPEMQATLMKEVRSLGHIPVVATDVSEGLAIMRQRPDLVILDLLLPHLSSLSFLGFKESHPIFREIPVLLFSDGYGDGVVEEAFGEQTIGYVEGAAFTTKKVLNALRRFLAD